MALKSEFCTCEGGRTAVVWCCHTTCNDGISLVFKGIGQQEFQFSNFVASQCSTSVVIPFDEKFNVWICFVESFKIPWFDIGNTRHQLFQSQKILFENFEQIFEYLARILIDLSLLWLDHLLRMSKLYKLILLPGIVLNLSTHGALTQNKLFSSFRVRTFPLEIDL